MKLPDFITHYSRGAPFRSITSLSGNDQLNALHGLSERNSWGLNRFQDPEYLGRRSAVEKSLRQSLIEMGGKPVLFNPIYFFLGKNVRFEQHPANRAHVIQLKDLSAEVLSFTYGDSLLAFHEEYRKQAGGKYQSSLCGKLFTLGDLQELCLHPDCQGEDPLHIEAQLWTRPDKDIVKVVNKGISSRNIVIGPPYEQSFSRTR